MKVRMLVGAIAAAGIALLGSGIASADTYTIEEQCRVATIPTSLCDGHGGVIPGGVAEGGVGAGVGGVLKVDPGKYYSGNKPDVQIGERKLTNEDGSPKLDPKTGEQMTEPIMIPGEPIFTPKPSDPNAVDLSPYDYSKH